MMTHFVLESLQKNCLYEVSVCAWLMSAWNALHCSCQMPSYTLVAVLWLCFCLWGESLLVTDRRSPAGMVTKFCDIPWICSLHHQVAIAVGLSLAQAGTHTVNKHEKRVGCKDSSIESHVLNINQHNIVSRSLIAFLCFCFCVWTCWYDPKGDRSCPP